MSNDLHDLVEPRAVSTMTRYFRRLVVEAPYIYARVTNPGGSILLRPSSEPDKIAYGTQIGNDAHLDLIEASMVLERDFSKGERDDISQWAAGFTSQQAAEYNGIKPGAIRKRRERLITKLEQRLNDRPKFGGSSDRVAPQRSTDEGEQPSQARDSRPEATETSGPQGDSFESDRRTAEKAR